MLKSRSEPLWRHGPYSAESSMLMHIKEIFDDTIQEYIDAPIDLLDTGGDTQNETKYIFTCRASYARTIIDIISYFREIDLRDFSKVRIL